MVRDVAEGRTNCCQLAHDVVKFINDGSDAASLKPASTADDRARFVFANTPAVDPIKKEGGRSMEMESVGDVRFTGVRYIIPEAAETGADTFTAEDVQQRWVGVNMVGDESVGRSVMHKQKN